jgi:hypothetical protein
MSALDIAAQDYVAEFKESIFRVRRTGFPVVYLSGIWSESDNPVTIYPILSALTLAGANILNTVTAQTLATGESLIMSGSDLNATTIKIKLYDGETTTVYDLADMFNINTQSNVRIEATVKSDADGMQLQAIQQGSYTLKSWNTAATLEVTSVKIDGSEKINTAIPQRLLTGSVIDISGVGLDATAMKLNVQTSGVIAVGTALTLTTQSDTRITGTVNATYNNRYLYAIEQSGQTLVEWPLDPEG